MDKSVEDAIKTDGIIFKSSGVRGYGTVIGSQVKEPVERRAFVRGSRVLWGTSGAPFRGGVCPECTMGGVSPDTVVITCVQLTGDG